LEKSSQYALLPHAVAPADEAGAVCVATDDGNAVGPARLTPVCGAAAEVRP
jgi:hypothetical protein